MALKFDDNVFLEIKNKGKHKLDCLFCFGNVVYKNKTKTVEETIQLEDYLIRM